MAIAMLGIDPAKRVSHLHGVDEHGRAVVSKRVSRAKLAEAVVQLALADRGRAPARSRSLRPGARRSRQEGGISDPYQRPCRGIPSRRVGATTRGVPAVPGA